MVKLAVCLRLIQTSHWSLQICSEMWRRKRQKISYLRAETQPSIAGRSRFAVSQCEPALSPKLVRISPTLSINLGYFHLTRLVTLQSHWVTRFQFKKTDFLFFGAISFACLEAFRAIASFLASETGSSSVSDSLDSCQSGLSRPLKQTINIKFVYKNASYPEQL